LTSEHQGCTCTDYPRHPELAQTMVLANHHIALSGMVFSPDWMEGLIRDIHCGTIPKAMLLLCLQEQRFAWSDFPVLSQVCHQLQLKTIILEALQQWGVEEAFSKLAAQTSQQEQSYYMYQVKYRVQCIRCELFVARAYSCMNTLLQRQPSSHNPEEDLANKMVSCLKIMQSYLVTGPDTSLSQSRKQQEGNTTTATTTAQPDSHSHHQYRKHDTFEWWEGILRHWRLSWMSWKWLNLCIELWRNGVL
jgi:hypothetical protein